MGGIRASADGELCEDYWRWAELYAAYDTIRDEFIDEYDGPALCSALVDYLTDIADIQPELYPVGSCSFGLYPAQDYPEWPGEYCFDVFPGYSAMLTYTQCDWAGTFLAGLGACDGVVDFESFVEVHNAALVDASACHEQWVAVDGAMSIWDLGDDVLFAAGFDISIEESEAEGTGTMDFELVAPLCPPPP